MTHFFQLICLTIRQYLVIKTFFSFIFMLCLSSYSALFYQVIYIVYIKIFTTIWSWNRRKLSTQVFYKASHVVQKKHKTFKYGLLNMTLSSPTVQSFNLFQLVNKYNMTGYVSMQCPKVLKTLFLWRKTCCLNKSLQKG